MTDPALKPLNARQRAFVDMMLTERTPTEAARRAGYRPVAAKHTARKLLAMPHVQAALAQARAAQTGPLTRAQVLEELRAVAFSNVVDYLVVGPQGRIDLDISRISRAQAAGFRELSVSETYNHKAGTRRRNIKVRLGSKVFALSRLLAALPEKDSPQADPRGAEVSPKAGVRAPKGPPRAHRKTAASR